MRSSIYPIARPRGSAWAASRSCRHIARDNPNRAATFVDELQEKCRQLVDIPEAFPLLAGREETGIIERDGFARLPDFTPVHFTGGGGGYQRLRFTSHNGQHLIGAAA